MATTATEILARAQALGYGSDTEAAQLLLLNGVHKRIINARRWHFLLETDTSKTLTAGTGTIKYNTLATGKRIDAVRIELNNNYYELEHMDEQTLRELEHRERGTGVPEFWTEQGEELHVWPIPDQAYKLVIDVVANPSAITTGSDKVQVPDAYADILVWSLVIPITFRERDWDAHNFARQMYAELYAEMLAQFGMTDRQTSKQVVESGFFDAYDVSDPWLP